MAVKIMVARQAVCGGMDTVLTLIRAMRREASSQPGFILGETLAPMPRSREILVITAWQTIDDWNAWFGHPVRSGLQQKMDAYLEGRTEYTIYGDV